MHVERDDLLLGELVQFCVDYILRLFMQEGFKVQAVCVIEMPLVAVPDVAALGLVLVHPGPAAEERDAHVRIKVKPHDRVAVAWQDRAPHAVLARRGHEHADAARLFLQGADVCRVEVLDVGIFGDVRMKGVVEGLRADMMRLQGVDDVEPPPVDKFLAEIAHHGEMPLDAFRGEHVRHVAYRVGAARLYEVLCVEEEHDLGRLGGNRGKRRRQQDQSQDFRICFHINSPPRWRLPI